MSAQLDPDFDFETPTGVPDKLPRGERIMWQGAPNWASLVRHAFHADKIALYFAASIALRLIFNWYDGVPRAEMLAGVSALLIACVLALIIVSLLAWQAVRTTVYTLTTHRVVVRYGMAFPMTLRIPLSRVASANLAARADGTGDIALTPEPGARLAYLMLWPHARAWHVMNPVPTLRSVPDAAQVAQLVGEALQMSTAPLTTRVVRVPRVAEAQSYGHGGALTAAE
jgi:membrane protein YdbS with pleckstrin-like domain